MSLGDDEGGATCARCKGPMNLWDKIWATNGAHPDAWKCVLGLENQLTLKTAEVEGMGSMLLDVQQDCIKERLRVRELEAVEENRREDWLSRN